MLLVCKELGAFSSTAIGHRDGVGHQIDNNVHLTTVVKGSSLPRERLE